MRKLTQTVVALALALALWAPASFAGSVIELDGPVDAVDVQLRTITVDGVVVNVPVFLGDLTTFQPGTLVFLEYRLEAGQRNAILLTRQDEKG